MTEQDLTQDQKTVLAFASPHAWEEWLRENHSTSKGIWLKMAKKETGIPTVTYPEALEVALCYGWIDSQKVSFDELSWLQKFTPRATRSGWSQVNREKAEALIAAGRMQPAGLEQVNLAKADGRWERAYASQSRIAIPEDFQDELDRNPKAAEFFATLNSANRYAVLYRIQTAKKPETRRSRIEKLIAMLNKGEKLHP